MRITHLLFSLFIFQACASEKTSFNGGSGGSELTESTESSTAPDYAVSQGSFSAWTVPKDPRSLESYTVVIEIRLGSLDADYTINDLSGSVTGTDGYSQRIGKGAPLLGNFRLDGNRAFLETIVPGGASLVQDIIRIQSTKLNESQELRIQF